MFRALLAVGSVLNRMNAEPTFKRTWSLGLFLPVGAGFIFYLTRTPHHPETVEEQANRYVPIQSDSERAAGHPIVGSI